MLFQGEIFLFMHTFYTLFLKSCSVFLGVCLGLAMFFCGWKKSVVTKSVRHFGVGVKIPRYRFRILLYINAGIDLFAFFLLRSRKGIVTLNKKSKRSLDELERDGGVLMTFHFSNFEFVGKFCSEKLSDFISSYQPTPHSLSNKFLKKMRSSANKEYVAVFSKSSIWDGITLLKRKGVFGFIMDQAEKSGMILQFGNGECFVSRLPSLLVKKTKAKSYVCYIVPTGFLNYDVRMLSVPDRCSSSPEEYANRLLYKLVEWKPYLWYGFFHKRYKWIK